MQDLKDAEIKVIAGPEKKSRVIPARSVSSPPITRRATLW